MRQIGAVLASGLLVWVIAGPAVAGGGGGGGCGKEPTTAATDTVDMKESCFEPAIARVDPGDAVTFVNHDPMPHMVTGAGMQWGSTEQLFSATTIEETFDEPGIYPYMCMLHPGMVGAIVVGDGDGVLAAGPDLASGGASSDGGNAGWALLVVGAVAGLGVGMLLTAVARRRSPEI